MDSSGPVDTMSETSVVDVGHNRTCPYKYVAGPRSGEICGGFIRKVGRPHCSTHTRQTAIRAGIEYSCVPELASRKVHKVKNIRGGGLASEIADINSGKHLFDETRYMHYDQRPKGSVGVFNTCNTNQTSVVVHGRPVNIDELLQLYLLSEAERLSVVNAKQKVKLFWEV